ncbi:MAG: carbohydrate kinase family protein [Chloroflexi bacterium]|nr:carbohydrate kinase family protein [Chloroflexota bacterium]
MSLSASSRIGLRRGAGRRRAAVVPRLVVLGDVVLDIVARSDGPLEPASDVPGTVRFRAGGSAANTARAFAGLGGRSTFIGAVGGDRWARRLMAALRAESVTVQAVPKARPTARLVVLVGSDGERSFVVERGAADALEARDLEEAWFRSCDALHLPGYSLFAEPLAGAARRGAAMAREREAVVSVDLASRAPLLAMGRRRAWQVLGEVRPSVIFGNVGEVTALTGERREERLLGLAPLVVVKEGAAGCRVLARVGEGSEVLRLAVATTRIAARDTTGAGDAFDAGFLHSILSARREAGSLPGDPGSLPRDPGALRRAALAGHRAAAALLRSPRAELTDR